MAVIDSGNSRIASNSRLFVRRRAFELLALAGASLAFVFVLAVACGLISG